MLTNLIPKKHLFIAILFTDLDNWELVIVRSLLDLEHNQARVYQRFELSDLEINLLTAVDSSAIRVACYINNDITSLIYSVL